MPRFLPTLVVLTLVEALGLSLVLDIEPLADRSGLAGLVGGGGGLLPLLFIGPVVLAVLQDTTLQALAARLGAARVPLPRAIAAFAAQLLTFGLFAAGTHALVTAAAPSDGQVLLWLLAMPVVPGIAWVIGRPEAGLGPLLKRAAPALALGTGLSVFVWSMGHVARMLWGRLYPTVLTPVHGILQATLTDVIYEPAVQNVGTERFLVNIAPVCSGLEGLGLLVSLAVITIYQRRAAWGWPRAAALIGGAVLLSWVANVVRISLLVMIGDAGYEDVALGGFHSKAAGSCTP